MIRWERNAVGESAASNVGVGYPGIKTVYYNPEIDVGSDFASRRHTTIRSSNDRQVVVVLQGDNRIPFYMEGLEHSGPSRVLAYDIDGNTHNLEFSFGIEGSPFEQRTTLRVNATSPAKRSDTSAAVCRGIIQMTGQSTQAIKSAFQQNPGGIYSQSNNFLGVVQSAVDPRTGQFNLAITLPAVHANYLSGPSFALTLAFSPLASLLDEGFGLGWSPLVTALTLSVDASFLKLSSGEQFAVDQGASAEQAGSEMVLTDLKLKSLRVSKLSDDSYRIDSKSGEVEILERVGGKGPFVLKEMHSPEGRVLSFDWIAHGNGGHVLKSIHDVSRTLLEITRVENSRVYCVFDPESESPSTLELWLVNGQLSNVKLPDIESTFRFKYQLIDLGAGEPFLFPNEVTGPLGAEDSITWTSEKAGHQLPDGAPIPYVPRVLTWGQHTGGPETTLYHHYEWVGNANHYGFGSGAGMVWESGRDNLYQVHKDYQYSVVETLADREGTTLCTVIREWDRFHLQTLENTVRGQSHVQVSTLYHIDPDLSWEEQPPYCQLPQLITTTYWRGENDQRSEAIEYCYDDYGNVTYTRFPSGAIEESVYHPAGGCDECPEDPLDMVRFLSRKTTIPAVPGLDAPTLCTTYRYENLQSLIPQDFPRAVLIEEQAWNLTTGQLLESTLQTYMQGAGPDYGRLESAVTTLNGLSTTTRYQYIAEADQLRTEVIVEGYDFTPDPPVNRSISVDTRSLLTGQTLEEISEAGVVTAYQYDTLGRIVQTVIAQGSAYQTTRHCDYHLDDAFINQKRPADLVAQVALEEADASKQRRLSWLDGKGRVVCVELEDLDNAEGTFRDILRTTYDPLGRVTAQTNTQWLADGTQAFELTTLTRYNDWGNASAVTSPTGVISHTEHDPIAMRTEQWQQGAQGKITGRQVSLSNVAGSPIRQEFHDDQGTLVRSVVLIRDGLDRVVEQQIKVTGQDDRVTRYRYDSYSRVIELEQPDATLIQWAYAAHSDGEHPVSVHVTEASQQ
jgi:YD repeat-containing protein